MNTKTLGIQQNEVFSGNEMSLKMELLKNVSLAQITNYINQQVSQSSTRFTDRYSYNPSLPSSKELSPDKKTVSGITEHQSTNGQSHEQCNKLIEELKSDKSKLEKKIEYSIKEKDQLKREKDDLVDRFKRKEDYWSSLYMKMFTAAETNEGLAALFKTEGVQMRSQLTSVVPSPYNSPLYEQDNQPTEREDMQIIDTITRNYLQVDSEENIPNIDIDCKYNSNNLEDKRQSLKQNIPTRLDAVKLNNIGDVANADNISIEHWINHKSEGYMRKMDGELINVTRIIQENNITKQKIEELRYRCATCKKLFQCEIGWKDHVTWMHNCGRLCICDVFSFAKYSHSLQGISTTKIQRDIKLKELKKLESLIATTMKKPELIEPDKFKSALETRRDIQREDSLQFVNEHKDELMAVESWLTSISDQSEKGQLHPLGPPICDAIVYPRCSLIFGSDIQKHDHELMLFLKSHGIAARTVGNTAKSDPTVAFVYLLDSDNEYTAELMQKLQRSLDDLASKIPNTVPPSELQEGIIQTELSNLYIRQTDYTKDYLSFLIVKSLNKNFDVLRQIGKRIGIPFSEAHSQLFTSIQFQSFAEDATGKQVRVQRLKAYNKWVHLLLTTSFKAALSMGTSKLFKGPAAFHMNKLQPSFNDGLLRIELSSYYYSIEQWKNEAVQMQQWNQTIVNMERALQEVEEQLLYQVSLKVFWDSFWFLVDAGTAIIDFQADLWTVVYAYSSRSYLFTGHHTDRHAKSGAQLTFLQRFACAKTLVRASNGEQQKQFLIYRHGHSRQIPIGSLNVKQVEENRMPIDMSTWFYHLSNEQLDQIYFICDNQQEFDEWFGQYHVLRRPGGLSEFENLIDQHIEQHSVNDEEVTNTSYLHYRNRIQDNIVKNSNQERKREVKFCERKVEKDKTRSGNQSQKRQGEEGHQLKKNGSKKGKKLWQCVKCKKTYRTNNETPPVDDSNCD